MVAGEVRDLSLRFACVFLGVFLVIMQILQDYRLCTNQCEGACVRWCVHFQLGV
jgi:hypothetical protein